MHGVWVCERSEHTSVGVCGCGCEASMHMCICACTIACTLECMCISVCMIVCVQWCMGTSAAMSASGIGIAAQVHVRAKAMSGYKRCPGKSDTAQECKRYSTGV